MLIDLIIIAVSGAAGAVVRYLSYLAGRAIAPDAVFPAVTLLVNVLGCLLIGIVMTLVARQIPYGKQLLLMGGVGFLGSFTTFSTFGFETLQLLQAGRAGYAALNVSANVALGLVAVWIGRSVL